ncbi:MAG: response regulator transcription factor [Saprospiraceae bacterium]|nr:response regulator transcription factor [Lewinella sp.]
METIKVLIADDHQIVIDGILSFLREEEGIEIVHTANNGREVLEKLQQEEVDVVILDINMPKMDGLEAARTILQTYSKTKILLLTMFGESQYIVNALKVGVHGYVMKEKSKEYLVGAIYSVYRGASYWSPEILARISDVTNSFSELQEEPLAFTEREHELLCMMVAFPGYTSDEIGREFNIASVTVDTHIRNMKNKIKVKKRSELIMYAIKNGVCEE